MRILVTGAAGYIGSVLTRHLLSLGYGVIALDDLSTGVNGLQELWKSPELEFVRGSAAREVDLENCLKTADAVVPLAGVVGMPACEKEPDRAQAVNVDAIRALMRLRSPSQRVIFPNTNSGYGRKTWGLCTEETPMEPVSLYGRQKCEAEKIVLNGSNTMAFRLATVFGPSPRMRCDLIVNYYCREALQHGLINVFEPKARRNFVHIDDVARAFRFALRSVLTGAFNLGNDSINMTKLDLAMKVAEIVSSTSVKVIDGNDPDQRDYVVSSEKLSKAGFIATRSLGDGIYDLKEYFRFLPS